jgi:hypothetical protein
MLATRKVVLLHAVLGAVVAVGLPLGSGGRFPLVY